MGQSSIVTVSVALQASILTIDAPSPTGGTVPLTVRISGMLTDVAGNGLGGKEIVIYWRKQGEAVWTETNRVLTSSPVIGTWGIYWGDFEITEGGIWECYTVFEGDAEYEGC